MLVQKFQFSRKQFRLGIIKMEKYIKRYSWAWMFEEKKDFTIFSL